MWKINFQRAYAHTHTHTQIEFHFKTALEYRKNSPIFSLFGFVQQALTVICSAIKGKLSEI